MFRDFVRRRMGKEPSSEKSAASKECQADNGPTVAICT